ncbi:hypothetical protein FB45DRAFT_315522 [Roridomyces roridus]|uniref:Uncharacterized protein n=1 Tax=Roridomyces roridus TaxID=1738132 RepID=A0AAD7FCD7_9AGAR|nr:hypothetical protein FB45DRAFT_315522 [Roridomyces roridus]
MAPSLPGAELMSNFISCGMYGIYIVTLGMAWRVLLMTETGRIRSRREIHWVILSVSTLLSIGSTLDLILGLTLTYQALVVYDGPGGAQHVYAHATSWQNFVKSCCVLLQTLAGDFILIYRCWVVNDHAWFVGLPGTIWLADVACAIGVLVNQGQIQQGQVNSGHIQWGLSFWSLTICTNIASTSLIVWRIWVVERQNRRYGLREDRQTSGLQRAMRNIVESGMIYTTCSILQLAAFANGSTWNYPASALAFQSVGISFNLIIIRGASLRLRREPGGTTSTAIKFTGGSDTEATHTNCDAAATSTPEIDDKSTGLVLSRLPKNPDSSDMAV